MALALLAAVEVDGAYANLVLPDLADRAHLDGRDRALATELGYGTLRWQGSLRHLIGRVSSRPVADIDPEVRRLLELGAYQVWQTGLPTYAAVSATVDLAPARARGFVNAVLRRVAERCAQPDPLGLAAVGDPWQRLGLQHAHPDWVVEAYRAALHGGAARPAPASPAERAQLAETAAALAANNVRPQVVLAARPGRITRADLLTAAGRGVPPAAAGDDPGGARAGTLSPWSVLLPGGDPGSLTPVRDGRAGVQDEGSQLVTAVALAAATAARGQRPRLAVDLCAGPGGKAALLAGSVDRLVAVEQAPHRARLVRRSGVAGVVVGDGTTPLLRPGSADLVLVDAPCTGLGALRRRPESRWRRQPDAVGELTALQDRLRTAAAALLGPGGVLAYVVCSPLLAEAAVAPPAGLVPVDARALLPAAVQADADAGGGRVQLWPHRHGTDAMSLALFQRPGPAAWASGDAPGDGR